MGNMVCFVSQLQMIEELTGSSLYYSVCKISEPNRAVAAKMKDEDRPVISSSVITKGRIHTT